MMKSVVLVVLVCLTAAGCTGNSSHEAGADVGSSTTIAAANPVTDAPGQESGAASAAVNADTGASAQERGAASVAVNTGTNSSALESSAATAVTLSQQAVSYPTSGQSVTGLINHVASTPMALQGAPAAQAVVGSPYSFIPTVAGAVSNVTFAIKGQPRWLNFDAGSGALSGIPSATDVGFTANITIVASAGSNSSSLGPFSVLVAPGQARVAVASPSISGNPANTVAVGSAYKFVPVVVAKSVAGLAFSIENMPNWATYNTATGELSGTPAPANVGSYSNVTISVSDGQTSAKLAPFSIAVAQTANNSAVLSWVRTSEKSGQIGQSDVAGYRISYGTSEGALIQVIDIRKPDAESYVVTNLSSGTWYFSVAAFTSAGVTGDASAQATQIIL